MPEKPGPTAEGSADRCSRTTRRDLPSRRSVTRWWSAEHAGLQRPRVVLSPDRLRRVQVLTVRERRSEQRREPAVARREATHEQLGEAHVRRAVVAEGEGPFRLLMAEETGALSRSGLPAVIGVVLTAPLVGELLAGRPARPVVDHRRPARRRTSASVAVDREPGRHRRRPASGRPGDVQPTDEWWNAPVSIITTTSVSNGASRAVASRTLLGSWHPPRAERGAGPSLTEHRRSGARPRPSHRRPTHLPTRVTRVGSAVPSGGVTSRATAVVPSTVPAMTEQSGTPERGEAESRDVAELLRVLDLEELDRDIFRGVNPEGDQRRPRLFGGQVAAQAARAASLTVPDDRSLHSLHGYFLRAGRADRPTILHVDRDRDGGSYSARHVAAAQDGEVIMSVLVSFHVDEDGPEFQALALPDGRAASGGRTRAGSASPRTGRSSISASWDAANRGGTSPGAPTGSGPGPGARSPRTDSSSRVRARVPVRRRDRAGEAAARRPAVEGSEPRPRGLVPPRRSRWTTGCSSTSCRWPRPGPAATTPAPCTTARGGCWRRSHRST